MRLPRAAAPAVPTPSPALALVLALTLAVTTLLPGQAQAQKKASPPAQPAVEERAAQILDKACKALAALKAYSFTAQVSLDAVYQDGSKIESARTMTATVARPASFKVVTQGREFSSVAVFDGAHFSLALPDRKLWGRIGAAMDTDALLDMLAAEYGLESPLGDLLSNAPCAGMKAQAGFYLGKATVDGAVCDQLFFQGRDVDWQLWVEDGGMSLPRKIVITEKKLPMAPQFRAVLSDWKSLEAPLPSGFAYEAPADFTRDDGVIIGGKAAGTSKATPDAKGARPAPKGDKAASAPQGSMPAKGAGQ